MAYRLDPGRSIGDEVRRVARDQLAEAIAHLRVEPEPATEDVHKARTSLKKLRSLLRLVRDELGSTHWRNLDRRLRDAGRALAGRRDADVVRATFETLAKQLAGRVDADVVEGVRAQLARERAAVGASTGTDALIADLDAMRLTVDGWPVRDGGFATIAPAVARLHRQGRRALAELGEEPDDEQLHELRKRAKDLWYQLRLLHKVWPPVMKVLADEAGELSDTLGDHHDLAVLRTVLCERHVALLRGEELMITAIDEGRARLEDRSRHLAARLYADPPKPWTNRLGRWWATAAEDVGGQEEMIEGHG
ncbi:MAG: CHAD domain-containing protein [Acidimicrobiales bacterium]